MKQSKMIDKDLKIKLDLSEATESQHDQNSLLKEPVKQTDRLLRNLVPFPIEHRITKSYKGKDMKLRKKKQAKQKERARQLR